MAPIGPPTGVAERLEVEGARPRPLAAAPPGSRTTVPPAAWAGPAGLDGPVGCHDPGRPGVATPFAMVRLATLEHPPSRGRVADPRPRLPGRPVRALRRQRLRVPDP